MNGQTSRRSEIMRSASEGRHAWAGLWVTVLLAILGFLVIYPILMLLLGALCKTFAPGAPAYFKGFTQGIMTGVIPILAVWFFCMGSSIRLSATTTTVPTAKVKRLPRERADCTINAHKM